MLIVNADDWGHSTAVTDATADCFSRNRISAASAMMFMQDAERAAGIAREIGIDVGLHLNFTEAYTAGNVPESIRRAQAETAGFLASSKLSPILYDPRLASAFRATLRAQLEEFERLYGTAPSHIDGHHHQHLCANVLFGGLLPAGSIVRRHYTFFPGEKSWANRTYRALCDRLLARRCAPLDGFFDLTQYLGPERLGRLATIAEDAVIELMVHPGVAAEHAYLTGDEFGAWLRGIELVDFRSLRRAKDVARRPRPAARPPRHAGLADPEP